MVPITLQMEQEGDSGLVPVSVPLELARDEVDSIMTSVDVTDNSAYWSLEQPQPPQRKEWCSDRNEKYNVSLSDSISALKMTVELDEGVIFAFLSFVH